MMWCKHFSTLAVHLKTIQINGMSPISAGCGQQALEKVSVLREGIK